MTKIRSRDARRIQDRRGQGGGGGMGGGLGDLLKGGLGGGRGGGIPIPGGRGGGGLGGLGGLLKGGGGLMGILLLAAVFFLPKLLGGGIGSTASGLTPASPGASSATSSGDSDACSSELEQILCGATNDVSEYWIDQLPLSFGVEYQDTQTVFFSGFTNTGCGQASSQTGPFYCPLDNLVYFDLDFLVTLQNQFGATGDLAAQYIVAHEFGHHVQNVLGINAQMRQAQQADPERANQYSVALELQADCFAGAWARDAADRDQFDDDREVEEALNAAAAVGDDRIQQQTQGRVDPESWTHGSSAQRVEWFERGFTTGDPQSCSTFSEVL
ncbi:MAG: neutral zinc metallopeptidase [Ilumatobacter sp.]|uniref:KPN_02809 family neutral zinc metallopeptidase n=1 Tax=Ilumatobacter sp. TaxID=1967498 RepID=UPI0026095D13|nr:neutral zinc metallopeptidase [Ilumatobacter sp.]MDJ0770386.1 neutral zinc metallopeptidase [Ilumatobacter sp.]